MSIASASITSQLPTKRKRAQICYTETDDDGLFDSAYESGDDVGVEDVIDDDVPDGDTVYGSRRKPSKLKRRNKKARLTQPRQKKPSKPFPFLELPPELRDYIYELALTEEGGLTLFAKTVCRRRTIVRGKIYCRDLDSYYDDRRDDNWTPKTLIPNLLAVNKQIHSEAVGYLYQQPIILRDTMALHNFIAAIGPRNRLQPMDLTIKNWGGGRGIYKAMNFAAFTMMAGCTNIKRLHYDCQIDHVRRPKHLAQQLYRDAHYFFEAYGAANGKSDAVVDVIEVNPWNFDRDYYYYGWRSKITLPEKDEFKQIFEAELRRLLGA